MQRLLLLSEEKKKVTDQTKLYLGVHTVRMTMIAMMMISVRMTTPQGMLTASTVTV